MTLQSITIQKKQMS